MTRQLLTAEVADRLRMSPDRVRDLVRDGVLPGRKLTAQEQAHISDVTRRAGLTPVA
jgi:hypothetical protein